MHRGGGERTMEGKEKRNQSKSEELWEGTRPAIMSPPKGNASVRSVVEEPHSEYYLGTTGQ